MKSLRLRFALVGGLTLLALLVVAPTFLPRAFFPEGWREALPFAPLRKGLDLQGGMYLVLEVDLEAAVQNALDRTVLDLEKSLKDEEIPFDRVARQGDRIGVTLTAGSDAKKFTDLLQGPYAFLESSGMGEGGAYLVGMRKREVFTIKDNALHQAVEILRNRIDQFGVAEPLIHPEGDRKIVVELPGMKDPARAVELIGKTALLEFRLVDDENPLLLELAKKLPEGIVEGFDTVEGPLNREMQSPRLESSGKSKLLKFLTGQIPEGVTVALGEMSDTEGRTTTYRTYLLKGQPVVTGDTLKDARVKIGGKFQQPYVSFKLDPRGGRIFEQLTGANVGRRLAIVLDGVVHSAPVIRSKIPGGEGIIEGGNFTPDTARDLAIVLRSGALPAPVRIIQNVTVGPTLGADSIREGVRAGVAAMLFVMLFMGVYYRLSGVVANGALILNILFLLAAMVLMDATLTLPGIAGIILAVGMAVDSNVLMFERIREELRVGKTPRAAVDAGYDKAFLTIVDAHVTTLITAVVLFGLGTGPIKGFAVSLSLGVLINLFTALIGTKVVFDAVNERARLARWSI